MEIWTCFKYVDLGFRIFYWIVILLWDSCRKKLRDFSIFCGLPRIYELYAWLSHRCSQRNLDGLGSNVVERKLPPSLPKDPPAKDLSPGFVISTHDRLWSEHSELRHRYIYNACQDLSFRRKLRPRKFR